VGSRLSQRLRRDARAIFAGALADCAPSRLLSSQIRFENGAVIGPDFKLPIPGRERVLLLAIGKASRSMAGALLEILPPETVEGVVVLPPRVGKAPAPLVCLKGDHPVPGANSFSAGRLLLRKVRAWGPGRPVIHLISGGASSLAAVPLRPWVSEGEKSLLHSLLVASGLGIQEVNVVRKHFSGIKGGRLAARAPGAKHLTLLLSDVPAGCPEVVGGGPTLPDPSTWQDCLEILKSSGILPELPGPLRRSLLRGGWPETPKPEETCFQGLACRVVADSHTLVEAAARRARRLGYAARALPSSVEDPSDFFVDRLLAEWERWIAPRDRPRCLLAAGEVRIGRRAKKGRGGRAQDLATAAALRLDGKRGMLFLAAGSDGVDGNSPAAGAIADGGTVRRARRRRLDPGRLRESSNTHRLFRELGDCVVTGATGNNLRDLYLLLEAPEG